MDETKRNSIISSLGYLYVLPLILVVLMLFFLLALIADKAPTYIINTILIFTFPILGCFTYCSFYIVEKEKSQRFIWLLGIINAIAWECVIVYIIFDSISSIKVLHAIIMALIISYIGVMAYLNYCLYVNDAKRVVEDS